MVEWIVRVFVGLGVIYLLLILAVAFFQDKLLFFPDPTPFNQAPAMDQLGFSIKDFGSPNGKLRYYLRDHEGARATVVVFHGNAGRAADRLYLLKSLLDLPLTLVLAEYPGYSGSSETPSQSSFIANALALVDHLQEKYSEPIVLMGESLGTGVVFAVANQRPIQGLILLSPYPSISEVAAHHYFYLPVGLLIRHPFPAKEWAAQLGDIPVLGFHGQRDEVIPYALGEKLWQAVASKNKKWVPVPEAAHNDLVDLLGTQLGQEIRQHFNW